MLHEYLLCIVYKDNYSSYVDLLSKDKSFTIHQRIIQSLAIKLFKVKRNLLNVVKCNTLTKEQKNTDLQFTVTGRFCQYMTLWPEFTKIFCSEGLGYSSL